MVKGVSSDGGAVKTDKTDRMAGMGAPGKTGAAGRTGAAGKGDMRRALKRSDNPDVLFGRDFDEEAMPMEEVIGEIGDIVVRGRVLNMDKREIKNERMILIYDISDFTDTMTIKIFITNEQYEDCLLYTSPSPRDS